MWHIDRTEFYSTTKENKIMQFSGRRKEDGKYHIQQAEGGLERQTSHALSRMRTLAFHVWIYMGISLRRCLGTRK